MSRFLCVNFVSMNRLASRRESNLSRGYANMAHKRRGNQGKLWRTERKKHLCGVFQRTAAVFRVFCLFDSSGTSAALRVRRTAGAARAGCVKKYGRRKEVGFTHAKHVT